MKKSSFALCSAYVAALAFIIVCIDNLLKKYMPIGSEAGFTYISFVAWAVYFFTGGATRDGLRAAIGYVIGITFSILIILLAACFLSLGFFAVPLSVFIIVFLVLYLEKVPWINLIPAMFVASGCYFGIMNYVIPMSEAASATLGAKLGMAAFVEIIYGFIGLLFGWIAVTGKGYIAKKIK